jgi:hypothetical protein
MRSSDQPMANRREPEQVAKRALVSGALAFRSSLEVTDHPRVIELSERLLPWLNEIGCGDELDPIEREELATPLKHLSESQKIDVNCAGEAASFFCWALKLLGPLEVSTPTDQSVLPDILCILQPTALKLIQSAALRETAEIRDTCRKLTLIRSML